MVEIENPKYLSVAHNAGTIIKIFTEVEESLAFAEEFEKNYGIKLKCDPLYNVLNRNYNNGLADEYKRGRLKL